jgi:hypothetical protein
MAASSGPDIVDSGLVLALDAADRNSFDSNENLLTYSKDFSAGWSSSLTVTLNNAIAPDGTLTAAKIQRPINSGNSAILNHPALSTNTNYCYSAFIKLASTPDATYSVCSLSSISDLISPAYASISYNFVTGTISSFGNLPTISGVIPYPNGWYRLYMVINTSSQTNAFLEIRPLSTNLVSDFYIWGAQLERGSSPSPYYPTTATTKTRGSTLIDLTGRGNTGTLTNGPTYSSANNGSIVFDGVDDYISLPTNFISWDTGNPLTISVWFKTTSTGIILGQQNGPTPNSAGGYIPAIYVDTSGLLRTTCFYSGFIQTSVSSSAVNNGAWNNITATFSSGTQTSYLNGISYATLSQTQQSYSATYYYFLGTGRGANWTNFPASPYLNGSISNFSYYNRALSASEIQQNFNATRSRFGI